MSASHFFSYVWSCLPWSQHHNQEKEGGILKTFRIVANDKGKQVGIIIFGQFITLCLASTGAASSTLSLECGVSIPTAQSGLAYMLLSLHLLWVFFARRGGEYDSDSVGRSNSDGNDNIDEEKRGILETDGKQIGFRSLVDESLIPCTNSKDNLDCGTFSSKYTDNTICAGIRSNPRNSHLNRKCDRDGTRSDEVHRLWFTNLPVRASPWMYLLIAFLDLEANYMTVLAFRHTSFTSIALLECFAIPSAMFSSYVMMGREYNNRHFVGVCFCLIGLVSTLWSDMGENINANGNVGNAVGVWEQNGNVTHHVIHPSYSESYPHSLFGDIIAIFGACMYGLNDTLAEFSVKKFDRAEFLGMLGLFGMIITVVQVSMTSEGEEVATLLWGKEETRRITCNPQWGLSMLGLYVVGLFLFYVGVSHFLVVADAALLNLSFLTNNLWAVLFSLASQRIIPPFFFFIALVLVVSGVVLYETGPSSPLRLRSIGEEEGFYDSCLEGEEEKKGLKE